MSADAETLTWECGLLECQALVSQLRLALLMLRQFCRAGGSEATLATIQAWVDDDMRRPLPWPDCPAFAAWASGQGLRNLGGRVAPAVA